jgi:hypothetical protein
LGGHTAGDDRRVLREAEGPRYGHVGKDLQVNGYGDEARNADVVKGSEEQASRERRDSPDAVERPEAGDRERPKWAALA